MNKYIILALALVLVVIAAGCVEQEADTGGTDENTDGSVEQQQPPISEGSTETENGQETGCITNSDCDDENDCTTDSCENGDCINIAGANCQFVETLEPEIIEVQFTGEEYVHIEGKNWDVEYWTVENAKGTVFFKFPQYAKLNRYVKIYSKSDFSTTTEKYAGVEEDFWDDNGDKVVLKDHLGNVISEMTG